MQDYGNSPHIDPRATFSRSDTASSGDWNASTNSPGLIDGSGTTNQYYRVSVAGTQDLGSGSITYAVGDYVKYSGSVWYKTTQPIGVTYWSDEKHLSSENLLLQSSDFDNTSWNTSGINGTPTGGQADPSGGADGFTLVEDSANNFHRIWQGFTASGDFAFTVYAKQNSGTRYLSLTLYNASSDWVGATFDLAGSAPTSSSGSLSSFSGLTATQTASGGGYYKCTIKATGSATSAQAVLNNVTSAPTGGYGLPSYTGDGTSSLDIAFASLTTTGATDYNATTTQIHREYAPSLKYVTPATGGMARFEYDPTDGQSMGVLIEGQSQNLLTYSSDISNAAWTKVAATASLEGVGPDGQLSAYALREDTGTGTHVARQAATVGSGSVAFSVYAKLLGNTRRLVLREDTTTGKAAVFDLSTGTVAATVGGASGIIESVGNGWYRCTMVGTPGAGAKNFGAWLVRSTATNYETYTGDGYSGLLIFGPQVEDSSFSSSYISTISTVTRAADSLSVTDSSLFDNGGGSLVVETENVGRAYYAAVLEDDSTSVYQDYVALTVRADNKARQTVNAPGSTGASDEFSAASTVGGSYFKIASRFAPNDFGVCIDGGAVSTDTTGAVPSNVDKLFIGWYDDGGRANAHIKRVAIYSEALSDTNLQSLTAS
jgi:hypothetical protein